MKSILFICLLFICSIAIGQNQAPAGAALTDSIVHQIDSSTVNVIELPSTVTPDATGINNPDAAEGFKALLNNFNYIYAFIVIIFGYISAKIPGLKKIKSGTYRVLTLAVIIGLGMWLFGLANIWQIVIGYVFSTSFYEVILSQFRKSAAPVPSLIEAEQKFNEAQTLLLKLQQKK